MTKSTTQQRLDVRCRIDIAHVGTHKTSRKTSHKTPKAPLQLYPPWGLLSKLVRAIVEDNFLAVELKDLILDVYKT